MLKMTKNKEYHKPERHIQLGVIANTPHWLRVHFIEEGKQNVR